jgi:hypothetical protein
MSFLRPPLPIVIDILDLAILRSFENMSMHSPFARFSMGGECRYTLTELHSSIVIKCRDDFGVTRISNTVSGPMDPSVISPFRTLFLKDDFLNDGSGSEAEMACAQKEKEERAS